MNRIQTAGLATALVLTLSIAACSDDDTNGAGTLATPAPTTTPAPAPSTTSTAPQESTTTSAPTTTAAPTTTVDEVAQLKASVRQDTHAARQAYLYSIYHIDSPKVMSRLRATTVEGSRAWKAAMENIQTLRDNGWRGRPNPDVPDTLTIEGDVSLPDGAESTVAELTVCEVGAGEIYEPGGSPDGSDTIVNDEIVARRNRVTMVLDHGRWKSKGGRGLGEWSGAVECPPE